MNGAGGLYFFMVLLIQGAFWNKLLGGIDCEMQVFLKAKRGSKNEKVDYFGGIDIGFGGLQRR